MNEQKQSFNFDSLVATSKKYNDTIMLTKEDISSGTKIYCKEDYAQELYDLMRNYEKKSGSPLIAVKDLQVGGIYDVVATGISFTDNYIKAHEKNSKAEVLIPFREFSSSIESLSKGENIKFKAMILKANKAGQFIASEKNCLSMTHKDELFTHLKNNTWFTVKIKRLIKGGYVAMYKNDVECFIPGSHAGANVIREFNKLLDTEITVMVDNYDGANDLFILSYKKYVKHSMPERISELRFGQKYNGTLTNKPYDFGIFVEIEGYFTGLLHSSDFNNYEEVRKFYKAGDDIEVYVKNVTKGKDGYRVILTLDPDEIDAEKKKWDQLRTNIENKLFDYEVDINNNAIKIHIDGLVYDVTLRRQDLESNMNKYPKVRVNNVDPINKNLKFEFANE